MASKTGNRRKKSPTKKKKNVQQSFVADEITIWLTLAVSILLLLSNFGLGGFAGRQSLPFCMICLVTVLI